jgi:hypothetical protein
VVAAAVAVAVPAGWFTGGQHPLVNRHGVGILDGPASVNAWPAAESSPVRDTTAPCAAVNDRTNGLGGGNVVGRAYLFCKYQLTLASPSALSSPSYTIISATLPRQ